MGSPWEHLTSITRTYVTTTMTEPCEAADIRRYIRSDKKNGCTCIPQTVTCNPTRGTCIPQTATCTPRRSTCIPGTATRPNIYNAGHKPVITGKVTRQPPGSSKSRDKLCMRSCLPPGYVSRSVIGYPDPMGSGGIFVDYPGQPMCSGGVWLR